MSDKLYSLARRSTLETLYTIVQQICDENQTKGSVSDKNTTISRKAAEIILCKNIDKDKNQGQQRIEGIAFAELIAHMKDTHIESDAAPVIRLAKLARLYKTRLKLTTSI